MHRFCEMFFRATQRWMRTDTMAVFINRWQVVESVIETILDSDGGENDVVELKVELEPDALLVEVMPSTGLAFTKDSDKLAFLAVEGMLLPTLSQEVGLYFNRRLLPALAKAWASQTSRMTSTIEALRTLCRMPERAGLAHLHCTTITTTRSSSSSSSLATLRTTVPLVPLSEAAGKMVAALLTDMPHLAPVDPSPKKRARSPSPKRQPSPALPAAAAKETEVEETEDEEETAWTTDHPHVKNRVAVAKYFDAPKGRGRARVLYVGHVVKYAPPSRKGARDQLYKIKYQDGDTEDFDEKDLQAGKALHQEKVGK
jgi:hypothetical protein